MVHILITKQYTVRGTVRTPSWFNSQDVMGVSPKPCSPKAYVMLIRRRSTKIKQRIRKNELYVSKSVKRKVQKSGGIFVNRREEKKIIEKHF
jgi:hypothetical protein